MNYTEEEIRNIAIRFLNKIDWGYDLDEGITCLFNSKHSQCDNLKRVYQSGNLPKEISFEEAKFMIKPYWVVIFKEIPEAGINTVIVLEINDKDGEPFYIRHEQARFKILQDIKGEYLLKKE